MRRPRLDHGAELDRIEAALSESQAAAKAGIRLNVEPLAQDIARLCDELVALPAAGGKQYLPRLGDLVAGLDELRALLESAAEGQSGKR